MKPHFKAIPDTANAATYDTRYELQSWYSEGATWVPAPCPLLIDMQADKQDNSNWSLEVLVQSAIAAVPTLEGRAFRLIRVDVQTSTLVRQFVNRHGLDRWQS